MKVYFALLAILIFLFSAPDALAQSNFSKTYPASKNIRLELTNREGTVTVAGWNRNEVKIFAMMEAPAAKIVPSVSNDNLVIDVVRDNQGRSTVGSVNFKINVPYNSTVDITTGMGNLTVRDISGSMVRANIGLDGDITLTNINVGSVMAKSGTGDIFFDGELQGSGKYDFSVTKGNVNIRIPFTSSFRLVATAPSSRQIELGSFSNAGLNFVYENRRVIGRVGDGRATLTVLNHRGNIAFIGR